MFKLFILIVGFLFIISQLGCATHDAYKQSRQRGETRNFMGWLFKPANEMSPQEIAGAKQIDEGPGYKGNSVRMRGGVGAKGRLDESWNFSTGSNTPGVKNRTSGYSYQYRSSVGGSISVRGRISPRLKDGYWYDRHLRRQQAERQKKRNDNRR